MAPDAPSPCRTDGDQESWCVVRSRTPGAERIDGLRRALLRPDLDERRRRVAERVVAGETYTKLGAEMGVTRQRVEQIVSRLAEPERWPPRKRGRPPKARV